VPHSNKKHNKKLPEKYMPIETSHCNISRVVDAIVYQIKTDWMTKEEFDEIYKQIQEKLKND
jgi:hypothetical protein